LQKLPADWKIQFFHTKHNEDFVLKNFKEEIKRGRIITTWIPFSMNPTVALWGSTKDVLTINKHEYSRILYFLFLINVVFSTQPRFWRNIAHENVLMFQTDSAICTPPSVPVGSPVNPLKLRDLFKYDYVGAPWNLPAQYQPPESIGLVGNGGLSFRKRSAMISILESLGEDPNQKGDYEDVFIVSRLKELNYTIADVEVGIIFLLTSLVFKALFGRNNVF
jgi:hypothetical protein